MVKRVLFATTHIHFPQGGGGLERNTHELCLALKARGLKPGVMCSLSVNHSWLSHTNRLKRILLRQPYPRDLGYGYPIFRGWRKEGAADVAAGFHPDLAIVQMPQPGQLVSAFARCGVPSAVYIHEVESTDDLGMLDCKGIPFLANSRFTAARLQERCGIRAHVIRPLINPADYVTPTLRERVLFINTVARKGLEIVLRLAESRPDIPFDLVRSWILRPDQQKALTMRALAAGNITLHPPLRDMRPLYARARLLLVPSQWEEAWGRVATEAHVNGIPVLASNRGGLMESVGPGGIILPAEAPHADWLAALTQLWDDPEVYFRYFSAAKYYGRRPEIQPAAIVDELCRLLPALAVGESKEHVLEAS